MEVLRRMRQRAAVFVDGAAPDRQIRVPELDRGGLKPRRPAGRDARLWRESRFPGASARARRDRRGRRLMVEPAPAQRGATPRWGAPRVKTRSPPPCFVWNAGPSGRPGARRWRTLVASLSTRVHTAVPSRIRRTMSSSERLRPNHASQSVSPFRQARLTTCLETAPLNSTHSARCPVRYPLGLPPCAWRARPGASRQRLESVTACGPRSRRRLAPPVAGESGHPAITPPSNFHHFRDTADRSGRSV